MIDRFLRFGSLDLWFRGGRSIHPPTKIRMNISGFSRSIFLCYFNVPPQSRLKRNISPYFTYKAKMLWVSVLSVIIIYTPNLFCFNASSHPLNSQNLLPPYPKKPVFFRWPGRRPFISFGSLVKQQSTTNPSTLQSPLKFYNLKRIWSFRSQPCFLSQRRWLPCPPRLPSMPSQLRPPYLCYRHDQGRWLDVAICTWAPVKMILSQVQVRPSVVAAMLLKLQWLVFPDQWRSVLRRPKKSRPSLVIGVSCSRSWTRRWLHGTLDGQCIDPWWIISSNRFNRLFLCNVY